MIRVLLVDDDDVFAREFAARLLARNCDVSRSANAEQARALLVRDSTYDIIVIDCMLPPSQRTEGVELLREVRRRYKTIEPIMISVRETGMTEISADAVRSGAHHFLDKHSPVFYDKLEAVMNEILAQRKQNVFLSHGHNELLKLKLKDFLVSRLGVSPVILSEQPSHGLTVVEKLERVSEGCSFAIVLMTKDDEVKDSVRARQNVVHEIGFFQGKYGRRNVVLLAERGVEMFSNISGIVRIDFEANHFDEVLEPLRIELQSALSLAEDDS